MFALVSSSLLRNSFLVCSRGIGDPGLTSNPLPVDYIAKEHTSMHLLLVVLQRAEMPHVI